MRYEKQGENDTIEKVTVDQSDYYVPNFPIALLTETHPQNTQTQSVGLKCDLKE
jgi:hypothetical protein